MTHVAISWIVFACVFAGTVFGVLIRDVLPQNHLSAESKETVKAGMGLVATMSALVLGLLVSSGKSFYDTQRDELTNMSSKIVLLDRMLAHYGPEAQEARALLRNDVIGNLDKMWPQERRRTAEETVSTAQSDVLFDKLQALSATDDQQRSLKWQVLRMAISLGQIRWLMYEQGGASISRPMLVILIFWLTALFFSFGLFAPRNATAITSLFLSGLSVAGAVFLILEMYAPFDGLIKLSSAPLRFALAHLGQ